MGTPQAGEEAGRIWEEGGGKGQGEVRSENSAKGLGGEKAPLHLCRGTAGTRPAEQKSELRNQKDGEETR